MKKPPPVLPCTKAYNESQSSGDQAICEALALAITAGLPGAENKIWHAHPVWFLDGNPIAGYSKLKNCVRLLFWSGQSFEEPGLKPEGSFKAAEARFTAAEQINGGFKFQVERASAPRPQSLSRKNTASTRREQRFSEKVTAHHQGVTRSTCNLKSPILLICRRRAGRQVLGLADGGFGCIG
jgi:hypothetical protein